MVSTHPRIQLPLEKPTIYNRSHKYQATGYIWNLMICKFQGFNIFVIIFSRIIRPFRFLEHSLTSILHMQVISSLINYLLLSMRSRSPHLATCTLISGLMHQKNCLQTISQSTIRVIQNGLKSGVRWRVWWPFSRLPRRLQMLK